MNAEVRDSKDRRLFVVVGSGGFRGLRHGYFACERQDLQGSLHNDEILRSERLQTTSSSQTVDRSVSRTTRGVTGLGPPSPDRDAR